MHTADLLVLKIGGSLFSDKRLDRHLDPAAVRHYARIAAALHRAAPGRVVLVSGGGAYGHGAVRDLDPSEPFAALALTGANAELRWAWTVALREAGVAAFPVQFAAAAVLGPEGDARLSGEAVARLLAAGVLPVLSGDCLPDRSGRLHVVGSDLVPGALTALAPGSTRIVMLTDVDGVMDGETVVPRLTPNGAGAGLRALRETPRWDTTGGMTGKLTAALDHSRKGAECVILHGARIGTDPTFLLAPVEEWPSDVPRTVVTAESPVSKPTG
jgi:isopentenyl phosphate kinase